MSECLKYAPMLTAREGELSVKEQVELTAHLNWCPSCQARLSRGAQVDGLVGEALLAEASRRDFSTFSDQVLERIDRRTAGGRLRSWSRRRALKWAGLLAPALAALALIVYLGLGSIGPARYRAGEVEVSSEGHDTMVIQTDDGPVVLWGDSDRPEGT